jgi:t-SNARE complex subunit (syntaxin)
MQNSITLSDEERKALLTKIEEMKKDLVDWQKDYSTTVIDVKQSMMSIKDDLDKMHGKVSAVELGKITVKQDDKKTATQTASPAKTTGTSNFKSGSVRKVSGN